VVRLRSSPSGDTKLWPAAGEGAARRGTTVEKPRMTAARTMATAMLPFLSSSHSSMGVSQFQTLIQTPRARDIMMAAAMP